MSRPLVLVGAGGLARETAEAARAGDQWHLTGYIDDDPARWGERVDGLAVLGGPELLAQQDDWAVAVCPGDGRGRAALRQRLTASGVAAARFASVVHPTAVVPPSCSVGAGSIVLAGAVLTASVTLGEHVVLMPGVILTHDDVLADYVTVCARAALGGDVRVGVAAYLGAGCLVRQHLTVGDGALLGMGSVVLADVPAHEVWAGVPARRLRDLTDATARAGAPAEQEEIEGAMA